jgi:hypothetical protein
MIRVASDGPDGTCCTGESVGGVAVPLFAVELDVLLPPATIVGAMLAVVVPLVVMVGIPVVPGGKLAPGGLVVGVVHVLDNMPSLYVSVHT